MTISRAIAIPLLAVPWLAAAVIFGFVIVNRFPPSGVFVATTQVDGKSPFINYFLPGERATTPGLQDDGWTGQRIVGDPVYVTARVPGPYDVADVEIEFRPIHQPYIEFGMALGPAGTNLDLSPMYFSQLQSAEWNQVSGGFVRGGTPPSRLTQTDPSGIAVWDATATMPLLEDADHPIETTAVSLRGTHDFYLVPSGGTLDATFSLQDVNRTIGAKTTVFRVFRGDTEIQSDVVSMGGSRDTTMGPVIDHRVFVDGARAGVYRISVQSVDDVFIRSVATKSVHWVVGPRLNVGDVVGFSTSTFPVNVWTSSRHVVAETLHREGLQTVTLGSVNAKVVRTHEVFRLDRTDAVVGPVQLTAPKGDIRIVGDGWFAFRPDAFFEPKPKRLTDGTDLDAEGINGVVTDYHRPDALSDGWFVQRYSFPLDPSMDTLRFVLSAPGIASRAGAVDVRRITISYHHPSLSTWDAWWTLVRRELANAYHRI